MTNMQKIRSEVRDAFQATKEGLQLHLPHVVAHTRNAGGYRPDEVHELLCRLERDLRERLEDLCIANGYFE